MLSVNTESYDSEQAFPVAGDVPLKTGGFCLNGRGSWDGLASGYKKAADILADHIEVSINGGDLVIHPIALLYRHHLELSLKHLIRKGNALLESPVGLRNTHSLAELWEDCAEVLENLDIYIEGDDLKPFQACIDCFENLDSRGEAFRYPERSTGTSALPANFDSVDLGNLRRVVDRMSFFLEICGDMISEKTSEWW